MKNYKLAGFIFFISLFTFAGTWGYVEFLKSSRTKMLNSKIKLQAESMQSSVADMISLKQNSTMAMALSMVNSKDLAQYIVNKNIPQNHYNDLVGKIRENTVYKNIWVQILDENLTCLYRSWNDKKNDSLYDLRKDLVTVTRTKKATFSISVGKYDLSIKAIAPVFLKERLVGVLEVVSHFNSISRQLSKNNISSVVLLKKEYKKQLIDPFTKMFVDDYYVANVDAPLEFRNYLQNHNPQNYFNNSYKEDQGYIIVSYPLNDSNADTIGYFIMFKKIVDISSMDLEYFMFKWTSLSGLVLLSILVVVTVILFFRNKKQKIYYKNIIDTATNIVLINNKKRILEVNNSFFKYFSQYKDLETFKKEHNCICDFFVDANGYLKKEVNGKYWVDHIVENQDKIHKAKINISGKEYYFRVNAVLVSSESKDYSIVLTDITKEENYQKELEYLTITDHLTGIYNRRYFQQKIEEEIKRAKRYGNALSVIMIDIDFFKKINDTHGHNVGDEVLVEYSKLIKSYLRDVDVFCRIGGEEFMIILPYATEEDAQIIAEKLRQEIETHKQILALTMSFGVTQYIKGESEEFLYKRVDSALYEAKESGRNRVVVR